MPSLLIACALLLTSGAFATDREVDADGLSRLARSAFSKKRFHESISLLDKALLQNPQTPKYLCQRADALYSVGEYKAALVDLKAALSREPGNVQALQCQGMCQRQLDDPQSALDSYNLALKIRPRDARTHFLIGNLYHDFAKYQSAEIHYALAALQRPQVADFHANRANSLRYMKRFDESLKEIDTALTLSPNVAEHYNTKSVILYMMGNKEASLDWLEKALKLAPKNSKYVFNSSLLKKELGDKEGALAALKQAVELDPKNAAALNNLGNHYLAEGKYAEARKFLDAALTADPRHINAYLNRAKLFTKLDQLEEAHLDIDQTRKVVAYNSTMGQIGDIIRVPPASVFREIVGGYGRVLRLNQQDKSAYYNRGCTFFCLGRFADAKQDFDSFLDINTGMDRTAVNAIVYSYLCGALKGEKDASAKKLRTVAGPAIKRWPEILIMFLRGDCTEEQLLTRAKSTTSNTTCHFVCGLQNLIEGKLKPGLEHLKWVVDKGDRDMDEFMMSACELSRRTKKSQ